jgi:antitoxin component YwqK of YwqJK toxin-antitoxin module
MKNRILVLLLILISFIGQSQNSNEKILYIIDGIPVIEDPDKDDDELTENDIELLTVITNKSEIKEYTVLEVDKVINITTKLYAKRSEDIKSIPSTKQMQKKNGTWYLNNSKKTYSGKFIDYYSTGKIRGEGTLFNGRLKGIRKMYYSNGNLSLERYYDNGISDGEEKEYYENGVLEQKGESRNGKKVGIWEMYHPNGQLKQRLNFNDNGKMDGKVISYYSTGKIKVTYEYKNGTYLKNKTYDKIFKYYNEGQKYFKTGEYKSAIKKYSKCIELDESQADSYFARGTANMEIMKFEEAISDFNKVLEIEPYYTFAYANRGFALMRKYEFGNSRKLSEFSGVQIYATKEVKIPKDDLNRICNDLEKAIALGDKSKIVINAKNKYCNKE